MKKNEAYRQIYTTKVNAAIQLVKPQNLYVVAGRATSKSMDILASRTLDIVRSMPRAKFALTADTYVNLRTNILPQLIAGWEMQGVYEGRDFVVGDEPDTAWVKPIFRSQMFKHTLHWRNGCSFIFKSLDRPSINAGDSFTHMFGDEAKYMKRDRIRKALPAIRGDKQFYPSHYFGGQTFTTDMPNLHSGDDDWILDMESRMDKNQIRLIAESARVAQDLELQLYELLQSGTEGKKVRNLQRQVDRWKNDLAVIRKGSTMFLVASTLVNIERLGMEYLTAQFESLGAEELKSAILSFKPRLETGARFYPNLSRANFYADGVDYDILDQTDYRNIDCTSLRYLNFGDALEAGYDHGRMVSLVVGQTQGQTRRVLKNFYRLPPAHIRELADDFVEFFKPHKVKILRIWVDRATFNYKDSNADVAGQLKHDLEYDIDGKPTGWVVQIMNYGQKNIEHDEEYRLMKVMMEGRDARFKQILIDEYNCAELKSSLEMAPLTQDSKGRLKKDKSSESLPDAKLPTQSTNFSDAFKYLICRDDDLALLEHTSSSLGHVDAGAHG